MKQWMRILVVTVIAMLAITTAGLASIDGLLTDDGVWYVERRSAGTHLYLSVAGLHNSENSSISILTIGGYLTKDGESLPVEKIDCTQFNKVSGAFNMMPNLTELRVNAPVSEISFNNYCTKLKTVRLANTVKTIGYNAFQHCASLSTVVFGGKEESIGAYAFEGDKALRSIPLPSTIKSIGVGAFCNSGLYSINIPSGVTTLKKKTFAYCSNLTTVYIPTSVTSIEDNCFQNCPSITVYYAGRPSQWNSISKGSGNGSLSNIVCALTDEATPPPVTPTPTPSDTTPPVISNVRVTNITNTGYTVTCTVTDNVGVTSVKFPTWRSDQQGGQAYWYSGTISGNTATCRINIANHGGVTNIYYHTHIYAYDAAGNSAVNHDATENYIGSTAPVIGTPTVSGLSHSGFTISVRVTDDTGVTRVRFPTWTPDISANGTNQDDLVWYEGTKGSDGVTWSCHVSTSDHKNETNCRYWTDIYAYDAYGNVSTYKTLTTNVPAYDITSPTIDKFDYFFSDTDAFVIRSVSHDNIAPTSVRFIVTVAGITRQYDRGVTNNTTGYYADQRIDISDFGNAMGVNYTCRVVVYDACGNTASKTITVYVPVPDTTKPVISDVKFNWFKISGGLRIPKDGRSFHNNLENNSDLLYYYYFVPELQFTVSDDVELDRVYVPYWTEPNGQDDLTPYWKEDGWKYAYHAFTRVSSKVVKEKTCYKAIHPIIHNDERGCDYIIRIYAYDTSGNLATQDVRVYMPKIPVEQNVTYEVRGDGTNLYEVVFNWQHDDNTRAYSLSAGNHHWACCDAGQTSATLLLPAGTYSGALVSYYPHEDFAEITDEFQVTVSAGTSDAGELMAQQEGAHKLYKVFASGTTWMGARSIAMQDPGNLARITNEEEQDAVADLLSDVGFCAWLGGFYNSCDLRNQHGAGYRWYVDETQFNQYIKGDPMTYTNWEMGHPYIQKNIMNCVQMTPEGYWRAIGNSETDTNGGYILEYNPTAIEATMRASAFTPSRLPNADDCIVQVTFEDGTVLQTTDFEFSLSGTSVGAQTLTVTYGDLTTTRDITIVESFGTPDFVSPHMLERIEEGAFEGSAFSRVMLADWTESIGAGAFANCRNLHAILIPRYVFSIADDAFSGCPTDMIIYGEIGSVAHQFAKTHGITFAVYTSE